MNGPAPPNSRSSRCIAGLVIAGARACARVLVVGEEMKGSRTRLRKVLPERESGGGCCSGSDRAPNFQGSAGVRGLAQLASLWLHCLSGLEALAYLFRPLLQDGRWLPRAGWATEAHGPLERYRDFRQKYARATSQPFRRAAGVLRPVRARQGLG